MSWLPLGIRIYASVGAFHFAGFLAAIASSIEKMKAVQRVSLPGSGREAVAKIFLGGLRKEVPVQPAPVEPNALLHEFYQGIREERPATEQSSNCDGDIDRPAEAQADLPTAVEQAAPRRARTGASVDEYICLLEFLKEAFADMIRLNHAIREISRYSLVKIDHRNNPLQLHRLVQAFIA